jgi:hypothetical protein
VYLCVSAAKDILNALPLIVLAMAGLFKMIGSVSKTCETWGTLATCKLKGCEGGGRRAEIRSQKLERVDKGIRRLGDERVQVVWLNSGLKDR